MAKLIDYRSKNPKVKAYAMRLMLRFRGQLQCFVDGVEVKAPHYINTNCTPHVVKSYDVTGDGKPHPERDRVRTLAGAQIETLNSGVLSRTVRGTVTYRAPKDLLKRPA